MENLKLLKKLEELGVTYCVSVPHQGGTETHFASSDELLSFIEDPVMLYAKHYGVSKAEYLAWANERFSVHCSGRTSRGKQCKNTVAGGSHVSPKTWVELQGEYCSLHGQGRDI